MLDIRFIWNTDKAKSNYSKHRISFPEAQSVFLDENARMIADPDPSKNEERFLLLGLSNKARFLAVCHCYREKEETIRIISARKATKKEEKQYHEKRI